MGLKYILNPNNTSSIQILIATGAGTRSFQHLANTLSDLLDYLVLHLLTIRSGGAVLQLRNLKLLRVIFQFDICHLDLLRVVFQFNVNHLNLLRVLFYFGSSGLSSNSISATSTSSTSF